MTAEQVAPAADAAEFEAQPGSLFYEVDRASSTAEKVELLEGAGFTETANVLDGVAYEKTEGGITLGYLVEPPVLVGEGKEASIAGRETLVNMATRASPTVGRTVRFSHIQEHAKWLRWT